MRQILSISLSKNIIDDVKSRSKMRGFLNVSEYIRELITQDNNLISESEILKAKKIAESEYKTNKTIKATSLLDLL